MHIVWLVLKVIGIVLLALLGLLLTALLLLLFVPVRYQAGMRAEETKFQGEARLSWLLGAAALEARMKDKQLYLALRLLWFRKCLAGEEEAAKDTAEKKSRGNNRRKNREELREGYREQDTKASYPHLQKRAPSDRQQSPPDRQQSPPDRRFPSEQRIPSGRPSPSGGQPWPDRLRALADRMHALWKRLQPLVDAQSMAYYAWLKNRIWIFLRHCRIRRIRGYLWYGTSMPDRTALLGGALYLLLPAGADGYEVKPDFEHALLQTDTRLSGHIRGCHAAWLLIRGMLCKDTWRVLRKIRGR